MGASVPLIQDEARLQQVWAQVLERLRGALNAATYSLTFERAQFPKNANSYKHTTRNLL